MRFNRGVLAGLAAAALYSLTVLIMAPFGSQLTPLVPAAIAAPSQADICANSVSPAACGTGYNSIVNGTDAVADCAVYSNQELSACTSGAERAKADGVKANPNAPPAPPAASTQPNGVDQDKCAEAQGPLSWILCPVFDRISNVFADGAKDLLSGFLAVQPLEFSGPIYDTWSAIRSLANVLFVLIFIFIIFANTFSVNVSSYSIRKMLPRLIAAALLVQASYLVSALIVDVGNVLGYGVGSLINSALHGGSSPEGYSVGALIENITTMGGAMVVLGLIAWELSGPLLLIALISIIAFIMTLAIRYLLIGVLIVISPLAFAAMVLPNTEQYFATWQKTFVRLVLMYPIIVAILSIAANVGGLIPVAAQSTNGASSLVAQSVTVTLIKMLVFVACFIAVTQTFKWAGGLMNMAYSRIDGIRGNMTGKVKDQPSYAEGKRKYDARRNDKVRQLDDKFGGLMGSDNAAKRVAGKGMFAASALALAGRSSNALNRQKDTSRLVKDYDGEMKDLKDATVPNLKNALMAYYGTAPERDKALKDLQKNGGEGLMDYTGSLESRQAMMRRLADNNLTGDSLTMAIGRKGGADLAALQVENGKNIAKSTMLFGRMKADGAPGDTNALGAPLKAGDINSGLVGSFMSDKTAEDFKSGDFKTENFKVMSNAKPTSTAEEQDIAAQATKVFADTAPVDELYRNFDANDKRYRMSPVKRAEVLLALARNKAALADPVTGAMPELYDRIVTLVRNQRAVNGDVLRLIDEEDDSQAVRQALNL